MKREALIVELKSLGIDFKEHYFKPSGTEIKIFEELLLRIGNNSREGVPLKPFIKDNLKPFKK